VAVHQDDLWIHVADLAQGGHLSLVAEADQVLGEVGLAGDAAVALLGEYRNEPVAPHPVDDLDRGDIGIAVAAALVLLGSEGGRGQAHDLLVAERGGAGAARGAKEGGAGHEGHGQVPLSEAVRGASPL